MTFMTYEERAFRETLAWRMNIRKKKSMLERLSKSTQ